MRKLKCVNPHKKLWQAATRFSEATIDFSGQEGHICPIIGWVMELIKFGNWSVSPYGVEWQGRPDIQLTIPLQSLVQTGINKKSILFHWPVEAAIDTRFSDEDIYTFNTAFFYAIDLFRTEIDVPNYVLLAETLKAQQDIMAIRKTEPMKTSRVMNGH